MTWETRASWPVKITISGLVLIVSLGLMSWAALAWHGGRWVFLCALCSLVAGAYLYRLVFRAAYRIDIDNGVLSWQSLTREGSFPLADLWEMRPERCGGGLVLETVSGSRVLVLGPRTVLELAECVRQQCPDVPVKISRGTRLVHQLLSQ